MSEIKRILMPTDFSENANQAFRYAALMADRMGAELTLLHVVNLFSDDPENPEHHFPVLGDFYDQMEKNASFKMNKFTFDNTHLDIKTETKRSISAPDEIVNYAEDGEFGLIVMGTHGRSAISHFLVGSVAEKVVRHAKVPVLTVSHQERQMYTFPEIEKILVPLDFSDSSKAAMELAVKLARPLGASLTFLHILDQRVVPAYHFTRGEPVHNLDPNLFQQTSDHLQEFAKKMIPDYLSIKALVREGVPHTEIVDFAKKNDKDLIIMGTHGLSGIDRVLIGSTTERVVRKAQCPVLSVHGGVEAED